MAKNTKHIALSLAFFNEFLKFHKIPSQCPIRVGQYFTYNYTLTFAAILPLRAIYKPKSLFIYKGTMFEKVHNELVDVIRFAIYGKIIKLC